MSIRVGSAVADRSFALNERGLYMRRMRKEVCLLGLFIGFLFLGPGIPFSPAADKIEWQGYGMAIEEAEEKGRPLFIFFYTDRCFYCRKMDQETFRDRKVVAYLKETFISSRVDVMKSPDIARRYMVRGFPTSWFLTSDGKAIAYLPGYLGPKDFLNVLQYIGGKYYQDMSLTQFLKRKRGGGLR